MSALVILLEVLAVSALVAVLAFAAVMAYLVVRYGAVISRIFETRPVFLPLQVTPEDSGEDVPFTTDDGTLLSGRIQRLTLADTGPMTAQVLVNRD